MPCHTLAHGKPTSSGRLSIENPVGLVTQNTAEPLAPMPPEPLVSSLAIQVAMAPAQPMSEAPLRPQARALASIPVEIAVQTGATLRPEPRPVFTAEARWDDKAQGEAWSVTAMRQLCLIILSLSVVACASAGGSVGTSDAGGDAQLSRRP